MDALSIASPAGTLRTGEEAAFSEQSVRPALRLRTALKALLEAWDYAHDLTADPWEFALEIDSLRRYELTNSDLRWLVGRGLVSHGLEVAPSGGKRAFQYSERLILSQDTCFVIAPAGIEAALDAGAVRDNAVTLDDGAVPRRKPLNGNDLNTREAVPELVAEPDDEILSMAASTGTALPLPSWDRDRLELRVGKTLALRFKIPAPQAESLVVAFQEQAWPQRIEVPHWLMDSPRALEQAVATLNSRSRNHVVRFAQTGPAEVGWEFAATDVDEEGR